MMINDYSYKPAPNFLGKGKWYIGIELEMEAPNEPAYNAGLAIRSNPRYCYAKEDSSIQYGWELVSHPIAYHKWLKRKLLKSTSLYLLFNLIERLRKMGYKSGDTETCGLHMHICRKAFGKDMEFIHPENDNRKAPNQHYYWFRRLINSQLFHYLSQRDNYRTQEWARQIPELYAKEDTPKKNERPHEAVNLTEKTVEVRIFRGSMRESRIRKAIEAVIASVEWSKNYEPAYGTSFEESFITYVSMHQHTYSNVYKFIERREVQRREEKRRYDRHQAEAKIRSRRLAEVTEPPPQQEEPNPFTGREGLSRMSTPVSEMPF